MKKMKALSLLLGTALLLGLLAGCTSDVDGLSASGNNGPGVYFLNFKPEQDAAYQKIAAAYTEKTGVPVTVKTAAGGTYDDQLAAEMSKTGAPTIFEVSGPVNFARWQDYAADLSDSVLYEHLTCPSLALTGPDWVGRRRLRHPLCHRGIRYHGQHQHHGGLFCHRGRPGRQPRRDQQL